MFPQIRLYLTIPLKVIYVFKNIISSEPRYNNILAEKQGKIRAKVGIRDIGGH